MGLRLRTEPVVAAGAAAKAKLFAAGRRGGARGGGKRGINGQAEAWLGLAGRAATGEVTFE